MSTQLQETQTICWNCEEVVHQQATVCPYCHKELITASFKEIESSLFQENIEEKEKKSSRESPPIPIKTAFSSNVPVVNASLEEEASLLQGKPLLALTMLLSGSFFFLFGVILKLFSENGELVLRWQELTWPYYIIPSCIAIALGYRLLSRLDDA